MKKRICGICLLVLSVLALLTLIGCKECVHEYDNVCDPLCNKCEKTRVVDDHVYDDACDNRCNKCNDKRDIEGHKYSATCDTTCDNCGATRKAGNHKYTSNCDVDCNICGEVREADEHLFSGTCDTDCNRCGFVREEWSHEYTGPCATRCMHCGYTRDSYEPHIFISECDDWCDGCGMGRFNDVPHTYDGVCDEDCNVCGTVRAVEHTYSSGCDTECNLCMHTRTDIEHTWGDWQSNEDATCTEDGTSYRVCSVCSAREERTDEDSAIGHTPEGYYTYNGDASHLKDGTESEYCAICGEALSSRTATGTAGHSFGNNGKCKDCGWYAPDLSAYMVYDSFEEYQYKDSQFFITEKSGFAVGSVKTYSNASYTVCARGSGLAEKNLRALKIARNSSSDTSGNEAKVELIPNGTLSSKHVIEFDIKISEANGADIVISGVKTVDGTDTYNELVRYDSANEQVIVCGVPAVKGGIDGSWYKVAIEIDDSARTIAIYVDGEYVAGGIPYTATDYPDSTAAVTFYRITAAAGKSAVEFYLDNIVVYNGAYRAN